MITGLLITAMLVLIMVVLYQVGQASELSTILKEEEHTNKKRNYWMAWSFLLMFPLLMIFFWYVHTSMMPQMLPVSASDHGVEYESMFKWTLIVTGAVFVLTQFLLFWYSFKYRESDTRTAFFFPHSNKLEIIWTSVPAVAMAILVVIGLKNWFNMTGDAPRNHQTVEVIGKQFNWIMRYPGPDGKLGRRNYTLTNDANNVLGLDWKDPATHDDIIANELHIVKGTPVELAIGSRDVIHDVGLPHFRMKMDAVPGVSTRMWFTPTITTEEMKGITKNPNFVYEISCDQMCGRGHYAMKGTVIVHDTADYKAWLAGQKSYYAQNNPDAAPAAPETPAPTEAMPGAAPKDSAKKITMNTK
jgi:cytochrome c oxidase subunit II